MSHIEIEIRSKHFSAQGNAKPHLAISGLSLTLRQNEFVCLVGPSGCGKTTLLNLIAGLDTQFEGRINFHLPESPLLGYMFQEPRLLPWRTVRQNLELALPPQVPTTVIDELLELTELVPFQHTYPQRLSLGMSRRVALARAFALEPHLLLMDEPFVSLDTATADRMRRLLIRLWKHRPHTILFVTHDLREAIALAERIVFLTPSPSRVSHEICLPLPHEKRQTDYVESTYRDMRQMPHE